MTNKTLPQSPVSVAEQIAWLQYASCGYCESIDMANPIALNNLKAILESLKRLEACERDAARYRWFCAQEYPDDIADDATKWPDFKVALDERIDAAIDSARSS